MEDSNQRFQLKPAQLAVISKGVPLVAIWQRYNIAISNMGCTLFIVCSGFATMR
jgi:hypothetical protein